MMATKKIAFTITIAVIFVTAIAFTLYYLHNKECLACGGEEEDCLNEGSYELVGIQGEPWCIYRVEVSGRTGCLGGNPYVHWQRVISGDPERQMMGTYDVGDVCTKYRTQIPLHDGWQYWIWFECDNGGRDPDSGYYTETPDCW